MRQVQQALARLGFNRPLASQVRILRRLFRYFWERFVLCTSGKLAGYRGLDTVCESVEFPTIAPRRFSDVFDGDSDLVTVKISLLGDCDIGKTSFMVKYVGSEEQTGMHLAGLNLMDKILALKGARIAFRIWDIKGDLESRDHMPLACKDAAAIMIMFDLTNYSTLKSAIEWYVQARRFNKVAIPVLIGTKFDDFARLPLHMQWTVVNEARACARAMKAALFFSSAAHNINVNKIFKFVAARHFDLPCPLQRNLNLGEPIVDF